LEEKVFNLYFLIIDFLCKKMEVDKRDEDLKLLKDKKLSYKERFAI
jgi:hypothetical protein